MARTARSVKGETVDFDLIEVKSKMQKGIKPEEVKLRENFIHKKRKRRGSGKLSTLVDKKSKELNKKKEEEKIKQKEELEKKNKKVSKKKTTNKKKTKSTASKTTKKETKRRKIIKK